MESRWKDAAAAWKRLTAHAPADKAGEVLARLEDVAAVRGALDRMTLELVQAARRSGKSWAVIATYLGVSRQAAWERWRDVDEEQGDGQPTAAAAVEMAARTLVRERKRGANLVVPNVVGRTWSEARVILADNKLFAVDASAEPAGDADKQDWTVTDQSPESGARVELWTNVRLWLDRSGGAGVREPRRPKPVPRSAREMLSEPTSEAV